MASKPRFGFVLEYVNDVDAAKQFYVDVLGLTIERNSPVFIQFRDPAGVNFAIASDEALGGRRAPEVYWVVDDAEAAYEALPASAEVSYPLAQKPFGTVFGVQDPAGETQFFVEFARERPSASVK